MGSRQRSSQASLLSLRKEAFGQPADVTDVEALTSAKLVVIGEIHNTPACIQLQCRTASGLLGSLPHDEAKLHIVLEHFNFEMQPALDQFASGSSSLAELAAAAQDEGHVVSDYAPLLNFVHAHPGRVALHAGFIPRTFARLVMRQSLGAALEAAKAQGYVRADEDCAATEEHYSFFESLLTGRNPHDTSTPPSDRFRSMFPAQVIKDCAMAHKVSSLVAESAAATTAATTAGSNTPASASVPRKHHPEDKFLVVCGIGHSGYSHGVPERIFAAHPALAEGGATFRIWCLPLSPTVDLTCRSDVQATLADNFGAAAEELAGTTRSPAELCLAFTLHEGSEADEADQEAAAHASGAEGAVVDAKAATAEAYQSVGETAHIPGDGRRARTIMARLGYTDEQIALAGADGYNFQGVGTPHALVALRPGEHVLDLGSGLGIDSFIAAGAVLRDGAGGSVTGVDLAPSQVRHASRRAAERGLRPEAVRFLVGDLERLPLADGCVDAVISNGAFCLAPDKPAAFREVSRVLKPGGRFAICTSAMLKPLDGAASWPLCMRMFAPLESLRPACEAAGLANVLIDESDSLMSFELPEDEDGGATAEKPPREAGADAAAEPQRNRVHVGSAEFEHLASYDVNELCARVVVTGRKPP